MTGKRKRKLAMPDTLIIVASVVLLVAILSWIYPSGTYDYRGNEHQWKNSKRSHWMESSHN